MVGITQALSRNRRRRVIQQRRGNQYTSQGLQNNSYFPSRSHFIQLQFQFIRLVTLATRQGKKLAAIGSSCSLVQLSTTHDAGFTLCILILNVKQGSCEYQFLVLDLIQPGIKLVEKKRHAHTTTQFTGSTVAFVCVSFHHKNKFLIIIITDGAK